MRTGERTSGPYVTAHDLPSVSSIEARIQANRTEYEVLWAPHNARQDQDSKIDLMVMGGAAVTGGALGAALGSRAPGFWKLVPPVFGLAFGAVAGMAATLALPSHARASDAVLAKSSKLGGEHFDLRHDLAQAQAQNEVTPETYDEATAQLLAHYDHNGDGVVNNRNKQALATDERISVGGAAATDQTNYADSASEFFDEADAHGNANGEVDGREIGRELVRAVSAEVGYRTMESWEIGNMAEDGVEWFHVHGLGDHGYTHELQDAANLR